MKLLIFSFNRCLFVCFEIMLRKRTGSIQEDQQQQHHMGQMEVSDTNCDYHHALESNVKSSNSLFKAPILFVGLGPKGLLDSDSVRSPTSPLDVTLLSNLGNLLRTPRSSSIEGQQQHRSWDCAKVGLGIIDSLEDCSNLSGKINILLSSETKKTSLSPQMITKPPTCNSGVDPVQASKSLPKDFFKLPYAQNSSSATHKGESTVLFEIGETPLEYESIGKNVSCSLDSSSSIKNLPGLTGSNFDSDSENLASPPHFIGGSHNPNTLPPAELNSNSNPVPASSSSNEFIKSLSASEIENSEDYTCVISHGPNPKTTHIFCDSILEVHANDLKKYCKSEEEEEEEEKLSSPMVNKLQTPNQFPSGDFLCVCYYCNNKLVEGEDIYIYR